MATLEREAKAWEIAEKIAGSTSGKDTVRAIAESLLAFPEETLTVKLLAAPTAGVRDEMNLIEAIQSECHRVRELLPLYESIGQAGHFGLTMLKRDIAEGEAAIASGDVVRMVRALKALRGCE